MMSTTTSSPSSLESMLVQVDSVRRPGTMSTVSTGWTECGGGAALTEPESVRLLSPRDLAAERRMVFTSLVKKKRKITGGRRRTTGHQKCSILSHGVVKMVVTITSWSALNSHQGALHHRLLSFPHKLTTFPRTHCLDSSCLIAYCCYSLPC